MEHVQVSNAIGGFLTGSPDSKKGVIVIQEWWGITDIIKSHAETIASRCGTRCLIPDIYHGTLFSGYRWSALFVLADLRFIHRQEHGREGGGSTPDEPP